MRLYYAPARLKGKDIVACNLYATTVQEIGNVRNVVTLPLRYAMSKSLPCRQLTKEVLGNGLFRPKVFVIIR